MNVKYIIKECKHCKKRRRMYYNAKYCRGCASKAKVLASIRWNKNNPEKRKKLWQRWYKANPEKVLAKKRRYYKNNSKRLNEQRRLKRKTNPELIRSMERKYYKNNPEKIKLKALIRYKRHCEKIKKRVMQWRKNNPGKCVIYSFKTRYDAHWKTALEISELKRALKSIIKKEKNTCPIQQRRKNLAALMALG